MIATKAMGQSKDSSYKDSSYQGTRRQYNDLDHRYGKIGISAVAAAVHHQGAQHNTHESRFTPYDSD